MTNTSPLPPQPPQNNGARVASSNPPHPDLPKPTPQHVNVAIETVLDELERAIYGKRDVLKLILCGLVADGHILLEDVPGVAKTMIARSVASVSSLDFTRVQFTPDLVPADITGSTVMDLATRQTHFEPGPIFGNLLLGDEINRAPPKTQAALLEAMAERQVTADGVTRPLPKPFLVIATQNPIESEGTYPLPEAQLDRFLFKTTIGYPSNADETLMLQSRAERKQDHVELKPILSIDDVIALQQAAEQVDVHPDLLAYMVAIVEATRVSPRTELGSSPRGSLALLRASRAWAVMSGRTFVTPDDVKAIAVPALAHRLIMNPDEWLRGTTSTEVMQTILQSIPQPETISQPAT